MSVFATPIKPGKLESWKKFIRTLTQERKDDFAKFNQRYGLEHHRAWLQHEPDGNYLVLVEQTGPGGDRFMQKLAQSNDSFDNWFKQQLADIHGMDMTKPPPEDMQPQLMLDA